jgi:uncharacterized protein (TIGR02284 family)
MSSLIQSNLDASKAYKDAAKMVDNTLVVTTFEDIAEKHTAFARDLSKVVAGFGGDPKQASKNIMKNLQPGWKNMKTLIKDGDPSLLIEECVTSERATLNTYREALRFPVPDGIIDMVWEQYDLIKDTRHTLENLRAVVN